ncbi:MAG: hypothetical protein GY805_02550 [Chloroflexi bacterium]|nr:hypothetical protein [Chloroflexota bacterium]
MNTLQLVELFDEVGTGDGKRPFPRHIQFCLQQVTRHGDNMMERWVGQSVGNGR